RRRLPQGGRRDRQRPDRRSGPPGFGRRDRKGRGRTRPGISATLRRMTQVPPVSAPVCYRHNNRETYIRCTRCDRPICPACMVPASVGHQCPECVAIGRRSQRQVRTAFGATRSGVAGYVTVGLIVTNVLLFIGSVVSAGNKGAAIGGGAGGGLLGSNT